MQYRVKPSTLQGSIAIPPSKSHTMRAILFATLAKGESLIRNYLTSPDTDAMISACRLLGATITKDKNQLIIKGIDGKPKVPQDVIDVKNSGQVFRFIAAIAALTQGFTILTGDHSIRTNRPIKPLLEALTQLGAFAVSSQENGFAPIIIKGPIHSGRATLNGEDSQPVSGLLIAAAFADGPIDIEVFNPGEKPWINLTLDWFKRLGIYYNQENYTHYHLKGHATYSGFEYTVPGDFSSAAFPLVAGLITHCNITLTDLDMQDVQGDKAIINVLKTMGAQFEIEKNNLHVKFTKHLLGKTIDVNDFIDSVTILAVVGCFAKGETHLTGAAIARKKESDRLAAITRELKKMGADITLLDDGLIVHPAKLRGAVVHSHHDHRVAMSLAIAALASNGETIIEETECVSKSFPNFVAAMQQLGALIEVNV